MILRSVPGQGPAGRRSRGTVCVVRGSMAARSAG